MKITLYNQYKKNNKIILVVENRYYCNKEIIPLGGDCHPAYSLQSLKIRKHSLPFDWLNTNHVKTLDYVLDNIENNFNYFLTDLYRNDRGHIVSAYYPHVEFMHEKNLIENSEDKNKFERRIKRFQQLLDKPVYFLFTIASFSFKSDDLIQEFYDSVVRFNSFLKADQFLCVYIRYDESLNERKENAERVIDLLHNLKQVRVVNYLREKEKYGLWGSPDKYLFLYKSLGINLKRKLPKIFFINEKIKE